MKSDNSTPTNEPIVDGRLLHEIEPRFDRFTNFNIPGRNYQQRESRIALNYSRQLTDSIKVYEVFGYRAVQHKFVEDGDFIGAPFDLSAHTVTMYPFSQQMDEDIFYQEMRAEIAPKNSRMKESLVIGGSYEWNSGSLESDFIFNDPDLFGFTIDYLNPVIPPRSEWQHDTGSRVYHMGVTGLFAQYIFEPTARLSIGGGAQVRSARPRQHSRRWLEARGGVSRAQPEGQRHVQTAWRRSRCHAGERLRRIFAVISSATPSELACAR